MSVSLPWAQLRLRDLTLPRPLRSIPIACDLPIWIKSERGISNRCRVNHMTYDMTPRQFSLHGGYRPAGAGIVGAAAAQPRNSSGN